VTKGNYPYPEDEFDAEPGVDTPVGVHRAPRTWWSRWWPFVAVIVLVPAVTIGAVLWASSWDGLGNKNDQANVELTDDPVDTPTDGAADAEQPGDPAATDGSTDGEQAPEAPATEEPPAATVDYAQAIDVLNAANRQGLAADVADRLGTAGFTSVTAGNGSASIADVTTVFYASPELQPTAQAVADSLGITTVTESADNAGSGVTVLLRRDFSN